MAASYPSLANQLLVALPGLDDAQFSRSVILLCHHDADGAMGLVMNRAADFSCGDLFSQLSMECADMQLCGRPVLAGGPLHPERGFVLHDGEPTWDSSLRVGEDRCITTSRDVLQAIAAGDGPSKAAFALGYASWIGGQLEAELREHVWFHAPASDAILFDLPLDARWQAAAGLLGVDMAHVADYTGHA